MNQLDFKKVYALAVSDADLSNSNIDALIGCATKDFKQVCVPVESAAKLLRECICLFSGGIDTEELQNMRQVYKKNVVLI